jgi:hypothetical protein
MRDLNSLHIWLTMGVRSPRSEWMPGIEYLGLKLGRSREPSKRSNMSR